MSVLTPAEHNLAWLNRAWGEWLNQLPNGVRLAVLSNDLCYFDAWVQNEMDQSEIVADAIGGGDD